MKFYRYAIIALMVTLTAIGLGSCGGGSGELQSIKIDQADPTTIINGNTQKFTVTATLSDGSTWPNWPLVNWSASPMTFLTINSEGLATTASVGGPTTITAEAQGHAGMSNSITVTVAP